MALTIVKIINYIICGILLVFLANNIGYTADLRPLNIRIRIILFIFSAIIVILSNTLPIPILKLLMLYLLVLVMTCIFYKKSIFKTLAYSILCFTLMALSEVMATLIYTYIFKLKVINMTDNIHRYMLYNFLNLFCLICTIFIVKLKSTSFNIHKTINKRTKILIFAIIILQLIRMGTEFFITLSITQLPPLQYISILSYICSLLSILLLLFCTSLIIDKDNVIKLTKEYYENLQVYNGVLQKSIEEQRKVAHEHGNQLTVLSGYIANQDLGKAQKYLIKLIGEPSQVDSGFMSNIKDSGLKALIVFKVAVIENKKIELETVIDDEIDDLIIDNEDMCNIVAVFLDNAIDAAANSEEPFISLTILKNDEGLLINIMNSISNKNIDTKVIYKKGYSTKGDGRGFGLCIVEEIVNRYEELELHTRIEEQLFIQELQITRKITSLAKK